MMACRRQWVGVVFALAVTASCARALRPRAGQVRHTIVRRHGPAASETGTNDKLGASLPERDRMSK